MISFFQQPLHSIESTVLFFYQQKARISPRDELRDELFDGDYIRDDQVNQ